MKMIPWYVLNFLADRWRFSCTRNPTAPYNTHLDEYYCNLVLLFDPMQEFFFFLPHLLVLDIYGARKLACSCFNSSDLSLVLYLCFCCWRNVHWFPIWKYCNRDFEGLQRTINVEAGKLSICLGINEIQIFRSINEGPLQIVRIWWKKKKINVRHPLNICFRGQMEQ